MIRALSILAAIAALAVSAAPVASAGTSKMPPSQTFIDKGTPETLAMNATGTAKGRGADKVANHTEGTVRGISAGRYGDGRFAGVKDGSSNTLIVGE
jgi:hypothetical protein